MGAEGMFCQVYNCQAAANRQQEKTRMGNRPQARLLSERSIEAGIASEGEAPRVRRARSVTINAAESPLGWVFARGLLDRRQYDAGERLRADWERARLSPRVTMSWDAAPTARGRGGSPEPDLSGAQIDAKHRFDASIESADRAWLTSSGARSARTRGCAMRKPRSDGRRGRASWC